MIGFFKALFPNSNIWNAIGSGIGGFEVIEREHKNLLEKGPGRISPFFIIQIAPNLLAGQVSLLLDCRGPNMSVASACATSGLA